MPPESAPARQRKFRVSAACDFCRRRKLKCDARPQCENCRSRSKDCTYSARVKKARPSSARIHRLEQENALLRKSLPLPQPVPEEFQVQGSEELVAPDGQSSDLFDQASHGGHDLVDTIDDLGQPSPQPSVPDHTLQVTAFHGPSSAMFNAPRKQQQPPGSSISQIGNQLLADAARQRQLEVVNFNNHTLDFDGVPSDLGMRLLSLFWNRQYYSGTVVYRPVFTRDMACRGPYFSNLLLNAIYFSASKNLSRQDDIEFSSAGERRGWLFRKKFENYLHASNSEALWRSEVTTIQALLVVADALFTWCDERTLSWQYMGIAVNMIIDLGIHVDGSAGLRSKGGSSPEDMEVYRRLFWSAYVIDKVQSIYQGRPARLRDMDNSVPITFLDEYEEFELFSTLTYSKNPEQRSRPTYAVSTFRELCRLSLIMDRILYSIYSEKSSSTRPLDLFNTLQSIRTALESWRANLPPHLSTQLENPLITTVLPHTLSLLSMYNSLIILLHRPFVSDGHLQSASSEAAQAFSHCATAALEIDKILQLYQKHFCLSTTPYFVSYATYVSATIHVRIAAQRQLDSMAHQCLQRCLNALAEHQTTCHAPRQTLKILKHLILRLGVKVEFPREPGNFECSTSEETRLSPRAGSPPTIRIDNGSDLGPMSDAQPEASEVVLGDEFMNVDIDEVMRSFAMASTDPWLPSSGEGEALAQTQSLTGVEDTLELDSFLSLDPLFGFNTPF